MRGRSRSDRTQWPEGDKDPRAARATRRQPRRSSRLCRANEGCSERSERNPKCVTTPYALSLFGHSKRLRALARGVCVRGVLGKQGRIPVLRPVANRRDTPKTEGRKYGPVFLFPQPRAGVVCVVCSRSLTQLTQTLLLGFESASGPLASAASGRICTLVASGSQRSRQRPVPARRSRSRGASRGFSVGVQVSSIGGVSRGHNLSGGGVVSWVRRPRVSAP